MITEKHKKLFWNKVEKTKTCWLWRGGISSRGYGNFAIRKEGKIKNNRAHRFAFELVNGKISEGIYVCHECNNPICVNPKHLYLGTAKDNAKDAVRDGLYKSLCGEKAPWSKLTENDVREIRFMSENGIPHTKIAQYFPVVRQQIDRIVAKLRWAHIK